MLIAQTATLITQKTGHLVLFGKSRMLPLKVLTRSKEFEKKSLIRVPLRRITASLDCIRPLQHKLISPCSRRRTRNGIPRDRCISKLQFERTILHVKVKPILSLDLGMYCSADRQSDATIAALACN